MALDDIVAYKKNLVSHNKSEIESFTGSLKPTAKSLYRALDQKKSAFIFEVKPSSPSQGLIRNDVDVGEIARIYAPFASAISVLADEKYFGGSYTNVRKVSALSTCPVLCKDVVVSPWQIYEARYYGADAALLMLSVLDDETYGTCASVASSLKMDVITEVHTEEEMKRAVRLGARIIGINNRNLKTLHIDPETTERLLPLVPTGTLVISESGFYHRHELLKLAGRVNGFLIGTALMRAPRMDLALRELLFGRVKICGLTNACDAKNAYESGAYYGGLNFSKLSKRHVSVIEAHAIKKDVPLSWGGLFVNQPAHEVVSIAKTLDLDFVQIHGDETDGYFTELKPLLPGHCQLWRAVKVSQRLTLPREINADRIVLDNFNASCHGGTGQAFDWRLLNDVPERHHYIIAGGINASNISEASALQPCALDIASGVEDGNPRKKSLEKMTDLFLKLWP